MTRDNSHKIKTKSKRATEQSLLSRNGKQMEQPKTIGPKIFNFVRVSISAPCLVSQPTL